MTGTNLAICRELIKVQSEKTWADPVNFQSFWGSHVRLKKKLPHASNEIFIEGMARIKGKGVVPLSASQKHIIIHLV